MLLGLIRPDSGTMTRLRPARPRAPARRGRPGRRDRRAAQVLPRLHGPAQPRAPRRRRSGRRARAWTRCSTEVGLGERGRDRFRSYSLGMKQRLAIAGTLLKDPELLIFDEPTNGLDPAGIHEIRETMRGLADAGRTVLVSSHILNEVQQVADTVTIIGRGRLLAEGDVDEILARGGTEAVRVRVPDPAAAASVLAGAGFAPEPGPPGTVLVRSRPGAPRLDAAEVTRALAQREIYLAELVWQRPDLEAGVPGPDRRGPPRRAASSTPRRHHRCPPVRPRVGAGTSDDPQRQPGPAGAGRARPAPLAPGGAGRRASSCWPPSGCSSSWSTPRSARRRPAEVTEQRQYYDQAHAEWEQSHAAQEKDCQDSGASPADCVWPEPTPAGLLADRDGVRRHRARRRAAVGVRDAAGRVPGGQRRSSAPSTRRGRWPTG